MPEVLFSIDQSRSFYDQAVPPHNRWHPDIPSVATVKPGESFRVHCREWFDGEIHNDDSADDIRDAELAHLLRRGGYPLEHIATVVQQVRTAGGAEALAPALEDWRRRLTRRGLAMLEAAAQLGRYMDMLGPSIRWHGNADGSPRANVSGANP